MKKPKSFKPKTAKAKKSFSFNTEQKKYREASQKMYQSQDWRKYRWRFLHYNKNCFTCNEKATVVDHIEPHKCDVEKFENPLNHMPLCKRCHDYVTGKFDSKNDFIGKANWIKKQRELNDQVPKTINFVEYRK